MAATRIVTPVSVGFLLLGAAVSGGVLVALSNSGAPLTERVITASLLAGLVVGLLPTLVLRASLLTPLRILRESIQATRRDGDLSRRVPLAGGKATAEAAVAYNELTESFQGIIGQVCFNSEQVAGAAEKLLREAQQVADGSERQRIASEATMRAIEEMNAGIRQVAASAELTAGNARSARELSKRGAEIVGKASLEMDRIARSSEVVATLGKQSQAISTIVGAIQAIADETALLALNAAIEAARAGDAGRSFGVVAGRVRLLAMRTKDATSDIASVVEAIQTEAQAAIASIHRGSVEAQAGATLSREAEAALQKINVGAEQTMESVETIAGQMRRQSTGGQNITELVQQIRKMAETNHDAALRTLSDAERLATLALNLKEVSTVFRLGDRGEHAMTVHAGMPAIAQEAARAVGAVLEDAIREGAISVEALFDQTYVPIPNTKPQKFTSRFDALTDRLLPAIQEPILEKHKEVSYAGAVDLNGYFPTHNRRFSQPLTGDEKVDFVHNRTKRIFSDPVGKRCGAHERPFLLQTYRRDTGEVMHDISAPIYVLGRHWGGFRIGYRTE